MKQQISPFMTQSPQSTYHSSQGDRSPSEEFQQVDSFNENSKDIKETDDDHDSLIPREGEY